MKRAAKPERMGESKIAGFPAFANWLTEYCQSHDDSEVRESWRMISYCFDLDRAFPNEYRWNYTDVQAFQKKSSSVLSAEDHNKLFWTDQARIIEAYAVTSFWRGMELLKPAIRSLNTREVITPAVLSRSLLELACVFIVNAYKVENIFSGIEFPKGSVVGSQEVEELITKMMWGTRIGDPEPHLKQTNVMTFINKLAKHKEGGKILPTYEYLCDIAHPCHVGNARFWSHIESIGRHGEELRIISREALGPSAAETLDKVLWSLGWSATVIRNAFQITSKSINILAQKLDLPMRSAVAPR